MSHGGGYVESEAGFSGVALKWMVEDAEVTGLSFHPKAKASIMPAVDSQRYVAPNSLGKKHKFLHGLGWVFEFIPKRIRDPNRNFAVRWIVPRRLSRFVARDAIIHQAVIETA